MVFGKKKSNEFVSSDSSYGAEVTAGKLNTFIGQGAVINGTIKTEGTLRIDGEIEGEVCLTGDLIIGETGQVNANITAQNVTVAGVVKGNIKANGKLDLLSTGKVYGDISVTDLSVNPGAVLLGEVSMTSAARDIEAVEEPEELED